MDAVCLCMCVCVWGRRAFRLRSWGAGCLRNRSTMQEFTRLTGECCVFTDGSLSCLLVMLQQLLKLWEFSCTSWSLSLEPTPPSQSLGSLTNFCVELYYKQFHEIMILNAVWLLWVDDIRDICLTRTGTFEPFPKFNWKTIERFPTVKHFEWTYWF